MVVIIEWKDISKFYHFETIQLSSVLAKINRLFLSEMHKSDEVDKKIKFQQEIPNLWFTLVYHRNSLESIPRIFTLS